MSDKKFLVISDTHGSLHRLEVVAGIERFDGVFHLGDAQGDDDIIRNICQTPVVMVRGNCDIFSQLPDDYVVTVGSHRIFLTHGHLYSVKRNRNDLARAAKTRNADFALFGHTHEPYLNEVDGVTVANPGSLSFPRGESAPSYMMLHLGTDDKMSIEIKEL